ncbi:MAG TPA: hypothetical protein VGH27_08960 [Streptosporangiaceae bacterium]
MTTQRVSQASEAVPGRRQWRAAKLILRLLVAAALAVDAYVHADLAPLYDAIHSSISQGDLFRVEAGVASAGALIVLAYGRRAGFALALLIAASALGAILLYRYVDVGTLGPIPNMYEPAWFPEKTTAAIAEAAATVLAAGGLLWEVRDR